MSDSGMPYENAILKGHRLQRAFKYRDEMRLPIDLCPNFTYLEHYGWAEQALDDGSNGAPHPQDEPKMAIYHDLRLSTRSADNLKICMRHIFDSKSLVDPSVEEGRDPWRVYKATCGFYTCVYNPHAILATASEGPQHQGNVRKGDIVPLNQWSDVIFLRWQQFCYERNWHVQNLCYIIQLDITNKTTIQIAKQALRNAGMALRYWQYQDWKTHPNHATATFPATTAEFQAILATPNGVGPAWFLVAHPRDDQMGRRMISAVTVFKTRWSTDAAPLSLCFHFEPV